MPVKFQSGQQVIFSQKLLFPYLEAASEPALRPGDVCRFIRYQDASEHKAIVTCMSSGVNHVALSTDFEPVSHE
jgi:hypothetical protein